MKLTLFILALLTLVLAVWWIRTMVDMPGDTYRGPLPPLTAEEEEIMRGLEEHVSHLAGTIGERNIWRKGTLQEAADYIEKTFTRYGYAVRSQPYRADGVEVRNLEVSIGGSGRAGEILLFGAHYDTVHGCPGANDNASGVAALLEIARALAGSEPARTVRLVAFVNEEPPFFQTDRMGSLVYTRAARSRGDKIVAALSLETIGYFSDQDHSQGYPPPFGMIYPDTGNFIGFVGNRRSQELVHRCLSSFRRHTRFPSEGIAAPQSVPGIGWSDHWSFWQEGYPAIMVTDTAPYRYDHYHLATDLPQKLVYDRMARVVAGLIRLASDLAGT